MENTHVLTESVGSDTRAVVLGQMQGLERAVHAYAEKLATHPIAELCRRGEVPRRELDEFVRAQYADSTRWVPMLSQMKDVVTEPRLVKALIENIECETGCYGMAHTTLAKNFAESIGVSPSFVDTRGFAPIAVHGMEIMNAIASMSEPMICGWLMVAEALVPVLFQVFRPAFERMPSADLEYFDEHIRVDSDEHAEWMAEAAEALLTRSDCYAELMLGIDIGARVTFSVPDAVYARTLAARSVRVATVV